jgi:hypothetical protein
MPSTARVLRGRAIGSRGRRAELERRGRGSSEPLPQSLHASQARRPLHLDDQVVDTRAVTTRGTLRVAALPVLAVAVLAAGMFDSSASGAKAASRACLVPLTVPAPPSDRPAYVLRLRVARGLRDVSGTVAVSFRPEVATDRVVFRLWPNSPFYTRRGASLTVGAVTAGGAKLQTSRPNATTLVVDRALAAGESLTLSMPWKLRLPRGDGFQLRGGPSARLVSFFPLLAWDGSTWTTDAPIKHADSFWPTSPTSDFDVHVAVPRGLRVLATGSQVGSGHWRAQAVRDFALAIGSFTVKQTTLDLPQPVRLLVGIERGSNYPDSFLPSTVQTLRWYSQRYGAYPWSTHTVAVMHDFSALSGTAYPTIGFFGPGSGVLVPHETAHQWFYSLVGNDQSRDPWLSEGLATWAQSGPEGSLASMTATSIPAVAKNGIGEPMSYWDPLGFEDLRLGVYVQTAQALNDLGSADVVDCALRQFVVQNAYRRTAPRDLLAALTPYFPDAEQKLAARGAHF